MFVLVIIKPDAIRRRLGSAILKYFSRASWKVVASDVVEAGDPRWSQHYDEHAGKHFYDKLIATMSAEKSEIHLLASPTGTVAEARDLMKVIRATHKDTESANTAENLVHVSDSDADAAREAILWFDD
jgi:nucleoside-diphosphate kinase